FAPGRKLRDTHQQAVFVKIGALLAEADFNCRFSTDAVAVPVGNVIHRSPARRPWTVGTTEILSLTGEPWVLGTAGQHASNGKDKRREIAGEKAEHKIFAEKPFICAYRKVK